MGNEESKLSIKDRFGQWFTVLVLFLAGLALYFIAPHIPSPWQQILSSVGLSFLGTSFATGIILAVVGSDVGGLRKEVNKLHNIINKEIDIMHKSVESLSTLASHAYNLGIIDLGRSRQKAHFEGSNNFVQRWNYLLEHAEKVDLICFADRELFNTNIFNPFFKGFIRRRLELQNNPLKLRIILSSKDNPHNKELNEWARDPSYIDVRLDATRKILKSVFGDPLPSDIIREHKSFVPFTLLRGDDYMYVMFFIPGHDGGPVIEIRPPESIAFPRATIDKAEEDQKLFSIYESYFEDMWGKNAPQAITGNALVKP